MEKGYVRLDTHLLDIAKGKIDHSFACGLELTAMTKHVGLKFCLNGIENYLVAGNHHKVKSQHCLILPPSESFEFYCSTKEVTKGLCIDIGQQYFESKHFDDEFAQYDWNTDDVYGLMLSNKSLCSPEQKIIHLLQVVHQYGTFSFYYESWLFEMAGLLLELNQTFNEQKSKLNLLKPSTSKALFLKLRKAVEVIHDAYYEPLTLEIIAKEAGLSKYHCQRYFKSCFNQSPQQYLESLRLEKAYQLYLTTHCSITELALRVGFTDASYFSKRFKKRYGISPSKL